MSRSSVLPRKRQGAKEGLCLDLSVCAISRCHGRYLSGLVDSYDPLVGDQRLSRGGRRERLLPG